jgi:hypothetical protein
MSSKFSGLVPARRVAEKAKGQKAETANVQPVEAPKSRVGRPRAKRSDPTYIQVTAYVPRELYGRTRARLFGERREFSSLVEELLQEWIQH